MARYGIRIEGLKELQKKLRAEHLYAEPLRGALKEAGELVLEEAQRRAPVETGRLRRQIKLTVSKAKVPKSAVVRANVTKRRFRYGWALNFSKKRPFRYRGTARRGARTFDWFGGARDRLAGRTRAILARAMTRIERQWQT